MTNNLMHYIVPRYTCLFRHYIYMHIRSSTTYACLERRDLSCFRNSIQKAGIPSPLGFLSTTFLFYWDKAYLQSPRGEGKERSRKIEKDSLLFFHECNPKKSTEQSSCINTFNTCNFVHLKKECKWNLLLVHINFWKKWNKH